MIDITVLKDMLVKKGLTKREIEVTELVIKGYTNLEIANVLFVGHKTIKFHLTNVFKKLCVKSRAQLTVWVLKQEAYDMHKHGSGVQVYDVSAGIFGTVKQIKETAPDWIEPFVLFEGEKKARKCEANFLIMLGE